MKDKKVIFTDNNIVLSDNPRSVVMDKASKSLMEFYSYIVCQNKGDVLDIGFGMGYSADKMYELADSYTCIEINPQIYKRASEWAKKRSNVSIIFGDWFDIIPQLGMKYDGIFMDTHDDPNQIYFEEISKQVANNKCILSIFNYFTQRDSKDMNEYIFNLDKPKFTTTVKDFHRVNWTVFNGSEYLKTSSRISFPDPTKII